MRRSASIKERIHCPIDALEVNLTKEHAHCIIASLRVGVCKPNFWPKILRWPSIGHLACWNSNFSSMK